MGVPSLRRYGRTVFCLEIVAGAFLAPWDVPSGTTQRSEPVSTKNFKLLSRSVMNRRPKFVEHVFPAINSCPCLFSADERNTVVYICAPCLRIAGGTGSNRDLGVVGGIPLAVLLSLERERCRVWPLDRAATWRDRSYIF